VLGLGNFLFVSAACAVTTIFHYSDYYIITAKTVINNIKLIMSALKSQQSASKAGQSSRDVNSGDRDVRQPHESQGSLPVGSMPRDSTLNPAGKQSAPTFSISIRYCFEQINFEFI